MDPVYRDAFSDFSNFTFDSFRLLDLHGRFSLICLFKRTRKPLIVQFA